MDNILNGRKLSKKLLLDLKDKIKNDNIEPLFKCILIGNNPASRIYIQKKKQKCDMVGIKFVLLEFNDNISTDFLLTEIDKINKDDKTHGCIIQLPLPEHINTELVLNRLDPKKDVDCFTYTNIGKLTNKINNYYPATPYGIILLLNEYNINLKGKNVVIIGKSIIVGTPLSLMLMNEYTYAATVTVCDKNTINMKNHIENADILIVAAGVHNLINSEYKIKPSCVLIDVGIHKIEDASKKSGYRLEGDIDFKYFKDKCSYITPVPGGVGPMTVYSLLLNIYNSYFEC